MKVTVVVLYRGCLAYYEVAEKAKGFKADLVRFNGPGEKPAEKIAFEKQGRHCTGTAEEELMDDLWDAVQKNKESADH